MRKSKTHWTWGFGPTANVVYFCNGNGGYAEREGYAPQDAESLCEYLNTRG